MNVSQPFCNGGVGRVRLVPATGGSPPYNYSSDQFVTSNQADIVFNNLQPGLYQFQAKDSTGCISNVRPITINAAPGAITYSPTGTAPACGPSSNTTVGGALGSISGVASGGTGGFQYSLDDGAFLSNGGSFTGVAPGTHTVVARDSNGCAAERTVTVGTTADIATPAFTFSPTPLPCNSSFSTLTVSPAPFTYEIDGVGGSSRLVQGLSHTIKVTNGACSKSFVVVAQLGTGGACDDNIASNGAAGTDRCINHFCTGQCPATPVACPANKIGVQFENTLLLCADAVKNVIKKQFTLSNWNFYDQNGNPTTDPATPDRISLSELNTFFVGLFDSSTTNTATLKKVSLSQVVGGASILLNTTGCYADFQKQDRKRAPAPKFSALTLGGRPSI